MKGVYLYAVMAGENSLDLGSGGVPDGSNRVLSVASSGFSAVVSPYDGVPFTELTREDLFGRLVVHQQVIEQVSDESSVLPARLGTILASSDEVHEILQRFQRPLAAALEDVTDAVEVNLSASWETNALFADIAQEPAVAAVASSATSERPEDNVDARVRVGMLVQEVAAKRREEYRRRTVGTLVPFTRDAQPNPVLTDDMVVNLALLVDRADLPSFDATVDRLGDELGERLTFRYVGPLPPYSFATIDVLRPDPKTIESARRVLALEELSSKADLESAYRRLAADTHPDRNPDDLEARDRFSRLTAARDTLRDYMAGQPADERPESPRHLYDLSPGSVAQSLVLRISRSDESPSSLSPITNEPEPSH